MNILIGIIQVIAAISACLVALLSIPLFFRFRWPAPVMWGLKVFLSVLSPLLLLVAILSTIMGLVTSSVFISVVGMYGVAAFLQHIVLVTRPPHADGNFEQAFGSRWERKLSPEQKRQFLSSRRILSLPAVAKARLTQDISFATIPGTQRQLLCDLWQPPVNKRPSGLAFIYLHGGAFYFLDKDFGTRPLFNHLAAQGHIVMDIAYRLAPETDIRGMIHDAKRAIVWMKENADHYGIDPERIIVGGASAGGSIALMAAYTTGDPAFNPVDLAGKDSSVCAVISLYGPTDFEAHYYHTNQHLTTRPLTGTEKKEVPTEMPGWLKKRMGNDLYRLGLNKNFEKVGALATIFGGHPDKYPTTYAHHSPVYHVHSGCPPTLLIHGEHDIMAPVKTTRVLHKLLQDKKIPSMLHILPQTDHGFDLFLPKRSPAAHNAIYDMERFMAVVANKRIAINKPLTTGMVHWQVPKPANAAV